MVFYIQMVNIIVFIYGDGLLGDFEYLQFIRKYMIYCSYYEVCLVKDCAYSANNNSALPADVQCGYYRDSET